MDNGLTLCLALMTRSEVFYKLNDGTNGLNDIQLATKYGLPVKNNAEYYAKIAKLYARKFAKVFNSTLQLMTFNIFLS